jgi:dimethylhistidine N-methyltransferase
MTASLDNGTGNGVSHPSAAADRVRFLLISTDDPLAHDGPHVVRNFMRSPKAISSVYVYDKAGTELFERQCRTPEYYLRRVEAELLRRHAKDIVQLCEFPPIVELGAGTAEKTRTLFEVYAAREARCDYFPIDIDTETLSHAAHALVCDFPHLFVHCLGTTYADGLRALPRHPRPRLFAFLGSSLGNMEQQEIEILLSHLFASAGRGDHLLLGADLHKDAALIDKAYNDSAGYGPRSTLNMLHHLNRRYGGNFVMENFRYRSRYDPRLKRNEVRIESLTAQTVKLASLDFSMSLAAGELIDAEVMWKFEPDELCALLDRTGFSLVNRWIEPLYRYGLFLFRRR